MSIELKHLRYAEVAERRGGFRKAVDLRVFKQFNLNRRVKHREEQLGKASQRGRLLQDPQRTDVPTCRRVF
jgi:hypothetical protein